MVLVHILSFNIFAFMLKFSSCFTACAMIRHTIFSWLKTRTLQNNEPYQTNVVNILKYVAIFAKYCNSFTWSNLNSKSFTFKQGGFGDLAPINKAPIPPNWNIKHYESVEFLSKLNVKPPLHKRKTPLLMTFWRWFCFHTNIRCKVFVQQYCWPQNS